MEKQKLFRIYSYGCKVLIITTCFIHCYIPLAKGKSDDREILISLLEEIDSNVESVKESGTDLFEVSSHSALLSSGEREMSGEEGPEEKRPNLLVEESKKAIPLEKREYTSSSSQHLSALPLSSGKDQPLRLTRISEGSSTLKTNNSLPHIKVETRPEVRPLVEKRGLKEIQIAQTKPSHEIPFFEDVVKGRTYLCVLQPKEKPSDRKWFLYASAKRGMNKPSDGVDIVCVGTEKGKNFSGNEVKDILLEKGLQPDQVRLIYAKGDEDSGGHVYLFARNPN